MNEPMTEPMSVNNACGSINEKDIHTFFSKICDIDVLPINHVGWFLRNTINQHCRQPLCFLSNIINSCGSYWSI